MLAMIGRTKFPAAFRKSGGDRGVGGPDGGLERRPTSRAHSPTRAAPLTDYHARAALCLLKTLCCTDLAVPGICLLVLIGLMPQTVRIGSLEAPGRA